MIGSGSVVAGLRVLSDPRRWIGPAVVVCVLAIAAVAAAPAAADSGVMINGTAASPSGSPNEYCSNPSTCITLTDTSNDPNTTETVTIESQTAGSPVTGVQAKIDTVPWSGFSRNGPCFELNGHTLACVYKGHTLMQNTLIVDRTPAPPSYGTRASVGRLISYIDVSLKSKALSLCDFPGGGARDFGPLARAAAQCTPPSRTRITQATIGSNSASFRFTGRLANHFQCVLYLNNRRVLNSSCRSPKSGKLPSGHYKFEVFGVNRAGFDPNPATKSFNIR